MSSAQSELVAMLSSDLTGFRREAERAREVARLAIEGEQAACAERDKLRGRLNEAVNNAINAQQKVAELQRANEKLAGRLDALEVVTLPHGDDPRWAALRASEQAAVRVLRAEVDTERHRAEEFKKAAEHFKQRVKDLEAEREQLVGRIGTHGCRPVQTPQEEMLVDLKAMRQEVHSYFAQIIARLPAGGRFSADQTSSILTRAKEIVRQSFDAWIAAISPRPIIGPSQGELAS